MDLWNCVTTAGKPRRNLLSQIQAERQPQERKKHKLICVEKQRLLEAYKTVTQKYAAAVTELHAKVGALSQEKYAVLYGMSEDLLQDVAAARVKLQAHVQLHHCR